MATSRPDLPRPSSFARASGMDAAHAPVSAPPRGRAQDPFLTRVVVLVDEATEPDITDAAAQRHRKKLMNIVLERDDTLPASVTNVTGGQAVAFALRKRLKSDDEAAVINTLTLLDELMRTVPYFYRHIASEKFFRRLWRFVVPDYKNGVKSMIPIFGKPKVHLGMRANQSVVSERVRILIRAWAEELSVMFHGHYDPSAGFLIERYNSKKGRVKFPDVPKTPTPWVCPVSSTDYLRRRGGPSSSSSRDPVDSMTLAEVENTVNLFANLVENATSISDLREDACAELARRCKKIHENIAKMSTNMSKEEELNRAIAVSETLQKSLVAYRSSLENGHIVSSIPTIDTISLHSDEDGYERPSGRTVTRSLDRYKDAPPPPQTQYDDSSDFSSGGRDDWRARDRELERKREAGRERANRERELGRANRERELERANRERELERANRERQREQEREREREKDRERTREKEREREKDKEREKMDRDRERGRDKPRDGRSRSADDREKYASRSGSREVDNGEGKRLSGTEKRSRKPPTKPPIKRREKSDSDLPTLVTSRGKPPRKEGLIDVPAVDESSDDEEEGPLGGDSFAMLAERYSSTKPSRKSKTRSVSKSKASKQTTRASPPASEAAPATSTTQGMPGPGMMASNPAAMYQSVPGMGYNPMMVPNVYAMYGSVSPLPVQDPLGMMNAYQTINPAMYYQTVNPQLYSMPSLHAAPSMPGLQPPQEQPKQLQAPQQPQQPQQLPPVAAQPEATPLIPVPQSPQQQAAPANNVPLQNQLSTTGSQQMAPMSNAASLYGSVSGVHTGIVPGMPTGMQPGMQPRMQPGMQQGMQPGMPLTTMGSGIPGMPGVMSGNMLQQAPSAAPETGAQAAAYQTAMHQAAVAFNAAATMYRSVSGQQPIVPQAGPPMQPGMPLQSGVTIQPAPLGATQEEEEEK